MTFRKAQILSIEEIRQRHRRFTMIAFCWYFLGYSAVVFWVEMMLLFFGVLTFFIVDRTFTDVAPNTMLISNFFVSLVLTVVSLEERSVKRMTRFRWIALRFHPLCFIVAFPVWVIRMLFAGTRMRAQYRSASLLLKKSTEDDGDSVA